MKKINNDNQQLFNKLIKAPSSYSYESLMKLNSERAKLQEKLTKYDKDGNRKENALQRKINKLRLSASNFKALNLEITAEPSAEKSVEDKTIEKDNKEKFATEN